MLSNPYIYWTVFALAAVAWFSVPVIAYLERRADRRDRELWARMYGMRR